MIPVRDKLYVVGSRISEVAWCIDRDQLDVALT
jgi:hypothetical protein